MCAPSSWRCRRVPSVPALQRPATGRVSRAAPSHARGHQRRLCSSKAQPDEQGSNSARDPVPRDFVEVKVDSVRVHEGSPSVVFLRVQDETKNCISVWIGEQESQALLREINKVRKVRPLTHDVAKDIIAITGFRVTKIRITDIINDTYYARIHLARKGEAELDVDARPSDAINLAVRFGAPMYVSKHIAATATPHPAEGTHAAAASESHAQIARSVREALHGFEDPTIMFTLSRDLASTEQRYKDAYAFQQLIIHEMTHNELLRLVVAMEAALGDSRYEEAARLRDEFHVKRAHKAADAAVAAAAGAGERKLA